MILMQVNIFLPEIFKHVTQLGEEWHCHMTEIELDLWSLTIDFDFTVLFCHFWQSIS